jgi:uncharacterized Fe-S cluster protein YjdI
MKKEYVIDSGIVIWEAQKCIHCGFCAKELSSVFQPGEKPWMKVDGASSKQIIEQVNKCPSGALSMK